MLWWGWIDGVKALWIKLSLRAKPLSLKPFLSDLIVDYPHAVFMTRWPLKVKLELKCFTVSKGEQDKASQVLLSCPKRVYSLKTSPCYLFKSIWYVLTFTAYPTYSMWAKPGWACPGLGWVGLCCVVSLPWTHCHKNNGSSHPTLSKDRKQTYFRKKHLEHFVFLCSVWQSH